MARTTRIYVSDEDGVIKMKKGRRPQKAKANVNRIQELRRSNAATAIPSGRKYNRAAARKNLQRGNWED